MATLARKTKRARDLIKSGLEAKAEHTKLLEQIEALKSQLEELAEVKDKLEKEKVQAREQREELINVKDGLVSARAMITVLRLEIEDWKKEFARAQVELSYSQAQAEKLQAESTQALRRRLKEKGDKIRELQRELSRYREAAAKAVI